MIVIFAEADCRATSHRCTSSCACAAGSPIILLLACCTSVSTKRRQSVQKRREESRRLKGACNLEREWERGIHKRLACLGEAGLHSMHAIMASTSCHELKRRLAVAVVVVV